MGTVPRGERAVVNGHLLYVTHTGRRNLPPVPVQEPGRLFQRQYAFTRSRIGIQPPHPPPLLFCLLPTPRATRGNPRGRRHPARAVLAGPRPPRAPCVLCMLAFSSPTTGASSMSWRALESLGLGHEGESHVHALPVAPDRVAHALHGRRGARQAVSLGRFQLGPGEEAREGRKAWPQQFPRAL